jgi:hypothetical protein
MTKRLDIGWYEDRLVLTLKDNYDVPYRQMALTPDHVKKLRAFLAAHADASTVARNASDAVPGGAQGASVPTGAQEEIQRLTAALLEVEPLLEDAADKIYHGLYPHTKVSAAHAIVEAALASARVAASAGDETTRGSA